MKRAIRTLRATADAGMSLVELLIYSLLLVTVLAVAGGIIMNSLSTQQTVTTVTSATSAGQLVSASVEQGIRNASAFQVATPTAFGQLLRSRTVRVTPAGVSTWQCQAWFRTATGDFYARVSPSSAIPAPTTAADLTTWTLVSKGVNLPSGVTQAFTGSSGQLTLAVSVDPGDADSVLISTTIVSRPQNDTGTAPTTCF